MVQDSLSLLLWVLWFSYLFFLFMSSHFIVFFLLKIFSYFQAVLLIDNFCSKICRFDLNFLFAILILIPLAVFSSPSLSFFVWTYFYRTQFCYNISLNPYFIMILAFLFYSNDAGYSVLQLYLSLFYSI